MLATEIEDLFSKTEKKLAELKEFFLETNDELTFSVVRDFLWDIEELIDSGFGG